MCRPRAVTLALIFAAAIGGSLGGCAIDVPSATGTTQVPPDELDVLGDTLFTDGFESGSLAWDDNFSPQAKSIVAAAAHSGAQGLRVTFTPTANGGTLAKFVARGNRLYVRAAVRFPANWTGAPGLLTLRAAPATNRWASFGTAGVCPDGQAWAVTGASTKEPSLDLAFHTYFVGMRTAAPAQCQGSAGITGGAGTATYTAPLSVEKGGWHIVELEAKLNTVCVADGWQKMWLDGTLKGQWNGLTFRTHSAVQWNAVSLDLPASGVTQTQTLDLDDILVLRGRPAGAAAVATVQVTPPAITLDTGATGQLTATVRAASGNLLPNRAVAWSSSNPAVASVSLTGVVTALVAGTATITATSEGKSGSAAIIARGLNPSPPAPLPPLPPPAPVATVSVLPGSATVGVGATALLAAVTRDSTGALLIGRTITWSTSASGVATVQNGVVTGRGAGQATITATSEGRSGSATITVPGAPTPPPPPPAGAYPNEPAGATVLIDWDFDISGAGSPEFFYVNGVPSRGVTVSDVTAPVNPSKIGRVEFSPGLTAGTGPVTLASAKLPPSDWKTWYLSSWFKAGSNYKNEMSFPGLKVWDMLTAGPNGSLIVQLYGASPPFKMLFSYKYATYSDHYGTIPLVRGVWYQVELLATDVGNGNVRYELFVNGVRDISTTQPRAQNAEFQYPWVMGGGPGTITDTYHIYHDHTRFSYTR